MLFKACCFLTCSWLVLAQMAALDTESRDDLANRNTDRRVLPESGTSVSSSLADDPNCVTKTRCRQCSFIEWKMAPECAKTGFVTDLLCSNQRLLIECKTGSFLWSQAFFALLIMIGLGIYCGHTFLKHRSTLEQQFLKAYRERK